MSKGRGHQKQECRLHALHKPFRQLMFSFYYSCNHFYAEVFKLRVKKSQAYGEIRYNKIIGLSISCCCKILTAFINRMYKKTLTLPHTKLSVKQNT